MSKEFKSLHLYREKIVHCIESYLKSNFKQYSVKDFVEVDKTRKRIYINIPEGQFYIDFHFNLNGTTTIEDFGGESSYIQYKKDIAKYIKKNCSISSIKCTDNDSWFVLKNIDKKSFESIIELLQESEYCKDNTYKYEKKDNLSIYKFKGRYNETLTITYYNTHKVQVQGKVLLLFNEAISMFTELIEIDDIPKCYNELYKLNINKDAVREKFELYMQNSYDKFAPKLKKCIYQAIYYTLIDADMFDYTAITLTAFRALEGHIKYSFKEYGIITNKNNRISFQYNKNNNNMFELKLDIRSKINNEYKIQNLEEAYNKYYALRHVLSHWDDLQEDNSIDTTKMIEDINVAKGYIMDVIKIIDSYYIED